MKDIVEIPTGDILEVTESQFKSLVSNGLIVYITTYNGNEINNYSYYEHNKPDIFDFLDRLGIDSFDKFFKK